MKRLAAAAALVLLVPAAADAQFADFEGSSGCPSFVAQGYQGFNWSNFMLFDTGCVGGSYDAGVTSASHGAFNRFGLQASVTSATGNPFQLLSSWVTAAWNSGMQLLVTGLLGGVQQYQLSFELLYNQATQFAFSGAMVDEVRFVGVGGFDADDADGGSGSHLIFDDILFGVPEPGSLLLLLPGLAGLIVVSRRRSNGRA